MKKLFFYQLLIAFTLTFFTIISCSKDSNTANNNEIVEETILNRQLTNPDVTDFLDDYYKTTYTFGETEEAYEDNVIYEVTEVFVNSTLPIGYVVSDKLTEDFLYFAHFDRDKEEIDAFDIKLNENILLTDLGENENGDKITDIDIIAYIKDNPTSERKFWGWQPNNDCHPEYSGTSPQGVNYCQTTCTRDYFVCFINAGTQEYTVGGLYPC